MQNCKKNKCQASSASRNVRTDQQVLKVGRSKKNNRKDFSTKALRSVEPPDGRKSSPFPVTPDAMSCISQYLGKLDFVVVVFAPSSFRKKRNEMALRKIENIRYFEIEQGVKVSKVHTTKKAPFVRAEVV